MMTLEQEVVLVTGASGNIGRGIAERLAMAGAAVVVHCHSNPAAADKVAQAIGGRAVQADLSDPAAVDDLLARVTPTMLVNNAARQDVAALPDIGIDEWRAVLATNLDGAFHVMQRCAQEWQQKSGGAIVNIASIEGLDPAVGHAHYATSKAALLMLTRAAALEYGPAGIRVNAVSPGLIDRDGLQADWPDGVARWLERAPLGRLGTPQDVADAVLFLLSPAARWISGTNLVVDGGMSAQSKW
ncbi:MAG: SDR family NAD(P)-dependent oxidoreductase [Pseudomonadota bacterium]